jgi:archaemetzincin
MRAAPIYLVPIYLPNHPAVLAQLAARLERTFSSTVLVRPLRFDPEGAFDGARGQYHATVLLDRLLGEDRGAGARVLGVAGVDLFIPILTYVFGEAQLEGSAAVVSTYRLDNALYGLPRDDQLTLDRLDKEATHELGHTFGLLHCPRAQCVMHSSTYAEDIDLKSARFCSGCDPILRAGRLQ